MSVTLNWAKRAALEAYVTLCTRHARRIRAADLSNVPRCHPGDDLRHIKAAVEWICRAQDTGSDQGVSAMFSLLEGWIGSYPETTGYIIPTLFDAAEWLPDPDLRDRAIRMADWLLTAQSPDGAFSALFTGSPGPPRIFTTGQVVFGLTRAWRETGRTDYRDAARRAADWLLSNQDADGAWRRNTIALVPHTYNVRTAWSLLNLGEATADEKLRAAALRNADWVLTQQCDSGWFRQNEFSADGRTSSLHATAFAMRGLLEIGSAANREPYIEAALRPASALHEIWLARGVLPGAVRQDWSHPGDWRCLPGEAQLALVWLRLDQVTGIPRFRGAAEAVLEGLKAAQILDESRPDLHGGITGSVPIDGGYERYCLVSWGSKFLIDALILKGRTDGGFPIG